MVRTSILFTAMLLTVLPGTALRAEELPEDATRLVAEFEENSEAERIAAEAKIAVQRKELAIKLKKLQDEYCKQAKLDEAVAIRDKIRQLGDPTLGAKADPGSATAISGDIGSKHLFKVTGQITGSVYGTDVYTTDSSIATAAVHAGILKVGETGVVRVSILPGRNNYEASTRNGVSSYQWQSYPASFAVERPRISVFPEEKSSGPAAPNTPHSPNPSNTRKPEAKKLDVPKSEPEIPDRKSE